MFRRLVDRLIRAPIPLYHAVTPLGRITGYFNIDLPHLNTELYRTVAALMVETFSILYILTQTLQQMPKLLVVLVLISYRLVCLHVRM
jgi:hypothetical protein